MPFIALLITLVIASTGIARGDPKALTPEDLARKNENGYVTGLPLANFDPNTGFGGGARGYYYFNGPRKDPLFEVTPYLHRVFLQFFYTTRGLQFHWLDYDAPNLLGTPYRIRSAFIYMRNTAQHFYGLGNAAMDALRYPGAATGFDSFSEYQAELDRVRPDGTTYARYDEYDLIRPFFTISLERTFLNGRLRPLVGAAIMRSRINDYTGEQVDAIDASGADVEAPMNQTRLSEQCEAGGVVGCGAGWDNYLRLGLSFDTRDFEPDPNSGVFADTTLEIATSLLGSDYDYVRWMLAARFYWSPIPDTADLVLAGRGTVVWQSGGTPFFSMNTIPYSDDSRTGLGGIRTMRGFKQDRFVGNLMTALNFEVRWTFHRFRLLEQKFALMLVPFVDTGRAYDGIDDLGVRGWRRGQGMAFRVSWNLATVVTADFGTSSEDAGLYINFNHQF